MKHALWCFLLCISFAGVSPATAGATTLPAGFTDSLVASVPLPTDAAFTPDGRMLITTQTGQLMVYSGGALLAAPALDLSGVICSNVERGLLGVAVDPAFATNHFIYLYYTYKNAGACPTGSATSPVNRVSRFTLSNGNQVDPLSETVLLDNIPSYNGNHDGGDVEFGNDGDLYVTVGDGGCDYLGTGGCGSANDASRDQNVLLGKVLRITSTGAIPADNPFQGANSARCNTAGRTDPGKVCQETYAWGLRNPFRIAFDPNVAGTSFYINDVGQSTWEEIDLGQAGADYGWNVREGFCATDSTTNCGPPPAGMTNPIFAYDHSAGCDALTGGAFVPDGIWPAAYDDAYLFSDYICGNMFQLVPAGGGSFTDTPFATGLGADSAVSMLFGPYNGSQALYYTTYAGGGSVRAISYTAPFNRAPTAALSAAPTSGPAPLTVSLDGSGSSDPDAGDTLTYDWSFGDGSPTLETTTATTSHVYTAAGTYYASLTVRDNHGAVSAPVTVRIDAGNTPPVPAIQSPAASTRFSVGQTITLQGSASDAQDGALPSSSLSWTVLLHDSTGTHTFLAPTVGNNVSITAPPPASLSETGSYLEIQLTATDSQGLATTVSQSLLPQLVGVTLATAPAGLTLSVNGTTVTGPQTVTSWAGYTLTLGASSQTDGAGQSWVFDSWSDGGASTHTIVTPAAPATFTASFDAAVVSSVPPVTAGLQLWFEAGTESYTNGQSVLVWHDKSGYGRDLSATGSADAPLYRTNAVNGRAAIEFNGTSSLLKTYNSTFTLTQPTTFFIVYRSLDPDSASARNYVFDSRNSSIRQALGHNGLGLVTIYANNNLSATGQPHPFPSFQIWSGTFNGANSTLAKNGQTLATGNTGNGNLNGFSVGALSTSNQYGYDYAHIQIAEILYYNTNLTTTDRQTITTWLTQKYAVH